MKLDRYAVIGNPVAHSRSPAIHAAFARQTGEPVAYERLLCPLDGFEPVVREFAATGGRGCNITVPFKFETPRLARHCSERARLAGAANVLRFDEDGWSADNSDGVGLVRDIETGAGLPIAGRRVLLVGAGGAGAGVLGPLLAAGAAQVVVANRTAEKARLLAESHAAWARQHGAALAVAAWEAPGTAFDIVINASATSLQGQASPVPPSVLAPGALAVDLMYGRSAEAFCFWRGVRPDTPPVLQMLRDELAAGR